MKKLNSLILYIRHISFIAYLIAMIYLYTAFYKYSFGVICLIFSFFYIITTFVMFFIKNKNEENSILNNLVLCFLHSYICFLAYRYSSVYNVAFIHVDDYFKINFFIIAICLFTLTMNKIIITNSK